MNRTVAVIAVVVLIVLVGGYFYFTQDAGKEVTAVITDTITGETSNEATAFCIEQGGTIETTTAAEGVLNLCVTADGSKVEAWQYMRANKTN